MIICPPEFFYGKKSMQVDIFRLHPALPNQLPLQTVIKGQLTDFPLIHTIDAAIAGYNAVNSDSQMLQMMGDVGVSVVRRSVHLLSDLLLLAMLLLLLLLAPTADSDHVGVAAEGSALAQRSRSLLLHSLLLRIELSIAHLDVDHLTHGSIVHV